MKQAYLAISLSNRPQFDEEIAALKKVLESRGIALLVFVDNYHFDLGEEKAMMRQAFSDIDKCELLLVEMSKKAVGAGIETGYAFAKKIPIIYLKRQAQTYSTTTGGCADFFINYEGVPDLINQFTPILNALKA